LAQLSTADIPSRHILHHSNNIGKIAFIRQIKQVLHIKYNEEIYKSTRTYILLSVFRQCNNGIDFTEMPYPHRIDNYDELVMIPYLIS
jgi:hypothetical protein